MAKIRVEIEVVYIPTMGVVGTGVQWIDDESQLEELKDLLSESVRGRHAFLKLGSAKSEIFIGREILILSKITVKRCEQTQA